MNQDTSPLTYGCRLRCSAEHAFATYVERIGEWWDPRYSANAATLEDVVIEPRVGGRIYAIHTDSADDDWGEVAAWVAGARLVHTFTLAQDARHPTEVAVDFADRAGGEPGSTVAFAHGGWTAANVREREKFRDWPVLLDRFAALADEAG